MAVPLGALDIGYSSVRQKLGSSLLKTKQRT